MVGAAVAIAAASPIAHHVDALPLYAPSPTLIVPWTTIALGLAAAVTAVHARRARSRDRRTLRRRGGAPCRVTACGFTGVQRNYRSAAGSVEALHAVDGAFPPGAIGALVGPSGSGKSTLLRILGGIDAADAGEVVVGGVDVRRSARSGASPIPARRPSRYSRSARRRTSIPQLTVREQLGADGVEHAERVGLAHRLDAVASALSGGEQARAALAVGLSRGTPVVLLDEPTAELDRHAAALVVAELRAAAADGRTVVVATHDAELVELADTRLELTLPTVPVSHEPHVRGPQRRAGDRARATDEEVRRRDRRRRRVARRARRRARRSPRTVGLGQVDAADGRGRTG